MIDWRHSGSGGVAALFAFSAARGWTAAALIAVTAAAASLVWRPGPILLWNVTPSSPLGLYAISAVHKLRRGDMVAAWAPDVARRLAAKRNYLPFDVPLVKPIAALSGDRVCAKRGRIFVNGRAAAVRRARDSAGRPMPSWTGCRRLQPGEILLLSHDVLDAFDGRYFGITSEQEVVGKARLLWPR